MNIRKVIENVINDHQERFYSFKYGEILHPEGWSVEVDVVEGFSLDEVQEEVRRLFGRHSDIVLDNSYLSIRYGSASGGYPVALMLNYDHYHEAVDKARSLNIDYVWDEMNEWDVDYSE